MCGTAECFKLQEYVLWNAVSVPLLSKLLYYVYLGLQLVGIWAYIMPKKVTQYAQNPEVEGLTYEDFEILRTKCIEVTTVPSQDHVT